MKAKKYAQRYILAHAEGRQEKEAAHILNDFFKEVSGLAHQRGLESDQDLKNIIDELDRKYRLYVRMVTRILPKELLDAGAFGRMVSMILVNIMAGLRPPKKQINLSPGGIILSETPLGHGEKQVAANIILSPN